MRLLRPKEEQAFSNRVITSEIRNHEVNGNQNDAIRKSVFL